MKIHKPKTIQEAIDELQVFLECDMPSKIFPEENIFLKGGKWERADPFKSREEVKDYLKVHFKILEKQIKRLK